VGDRSARPFIRWAGSKKKLLPELKANMPADYNRYIEPFCGSACLFFELSPERALLSDINQELINAYRVLRDRSDIYKKLLSLPVTKDFYYQMRRKNPARMSEYNRAVRFLYLNRYCFNGIYRTNQKGEFNVPMGNRTGSFPSEEEYLKIVDSLSGVELLVGDYALALESAKKDDFVYMDPPYAEGGKFTGEYGRGSFDGGRLNELYGGLDKLDKKGVKFLFSYRCSEGVIRSLEDRYHVVELDVKRHISGFKTGWDTVKEIMVKNYA